MKEPAEHPTTAGFGCNRSSSCLWGQEKHPDISGLCATLKPAERNLAWLVSPLKHSGIIMLALFLLEFSVDTQTSVFLTLDASTGDCQ